MWVPPPPISPPPPSLLMADDGGELCPDALSAACELSCALQPGQRGCCAGQACRCEQTEPGPWGRGGVAGPLSHPLPACGWGPASAQGRPSFSPVRVTGLGGRGVGAGLLPQAAGGHSGLFEGAASEWVVRTRPPPERGTKASDCPPGELVCSWVFVSGLYF